MCFDHGKSRRNVLTLHLKFAGITIRSSLNTGGQSSCFGQLTPEAINSNTERVHPSHHSIPGSERRNKNSCENDQVCKTDKIDPSVKHKLSRLTEGFLFLYHYTLALSLEDFYHFFESTAPEIGCNNYCQKPVGLI